MQDERFIYLMFSSTRCGVGSFIRFMTGRFYNHVSISFDAQLSELYSFARIYKHAPLYGGFVSESNMRYIGETPIKVCRIALTDEQYNQIKSKIEDMKCHKDTYIYNLISAMTYPFKRKINISSAFTCVEFASYLLSAVGIENGENERGFCSIESLEGLFENDIVYEGVFPESRIIDDWKDDMYNEKIGVVGAVKHTVRNNARLVKRMFTGSRRNSA